MGRFRAIWREGESKLQILESRSCCEDARKDEASFDLAQNRAIQILRFIVSLLHNLTLRESQTLLRWSRFSSHHGNASNNNENNQKQNQSQSNASIITPMNFSSCLKWRKTYTSVILRLSDAISSSDHDENIFVSRRIIRKFQFNTLQHQIIMTMSTRSSALKAESFVILTWMVNYLRFLGPGFRARKYMVRGLELLSGAASRIGLPSPFARSKSVLEPYELFLRGQYLSRSLSLPIDFASPLVPAMTACGYDSGDDTGWLEKFSSKVHDANGDDGAAASFIPFSFARSFSSIDDCRSQRFPRVPLPESQILLYGKCFWKSARLLEDWFCRSMELVIPWPHDQIMHFNSYYHHSFRPIWDWFELSPAEWQQQHFAASFSHESYGDLVIEPMWNVFRHHPALELPVGLILFEGQSAYINPITGGGGENDVRRLVAHDALAVGQILDRKRPISTSWHPNSALSFAQTSQLHDATLAVYRIAAPGVRGFPAEALHSRPPRSLPFIDECEITLQPHLRMKVERIERDVTFQHFPLPYSLSKTVTSSLLVPAVVWFTVEPMNQ